MRNRSVMVHFSLRESKKSKKGLSPIEVSVSYNGERIYFSTGKAVKPSEWNKKKQVVRGDSQEAALTNSYLVEFRNRIYEKEIELMSRGFTITVHMLKEAMLNNIECLKEKSLMQMMAEYNNEKERLIGKGVAYLTYKRSAYCKKLLGEFIGKVYKRKDIYLHEVNAGFVESFHSFLVTTKGVTHNTSTNYISYLKAIMNKAAANCYIQYNPIAGYKVSRDPVDIDFLTEDELRRVMEFSSPIGRYEKARDFFLFGCFTGLSYVDIRTLEPKHIVEDDQGRVWIRKRRVKTGVLSRVPLHPFARHIMEKYKGGSSLIPIYDCSYINKILKDIAQLCHIDKHVTFHTSRHNKIFY